MTNAAAERMARGSRTGWMRPWRPSATMLLALWRARCVGLGAWRPRSEWALSSVWRASMQHQSGLPAKLGHAGGVIEALRCGGEDDSEDAIDNGNGLVMVRLDDGPTVAVHASAQPHSTSSARTRSSSTDASGTCFRCNAACRRPDRWQWSAPGTCSPSMSGSTFPLPYSPDPHARTRPVKTRARR